MELLYSIFDAILGPRIDWLDYANTEPPSPRKRDIGIKLLKREIRKGNVDKEIIPYLKRINKNKSVLTIFSCSGHPTSDEAKSGYVWIEVLEKSPTTFSHLVHPLCQSLGIKPLTEYRDMKDTYQVEVEESKDGVWLSFTLRWENVWNMAYAMEILIEHIERFEEYLAKRSN